MKGLAESSPFHLLTNPHVINRFIFGHGVVIYYILEAIGLNLWRIASKITVKMAKTADLQKLQFSKVYTCCSR